MVTGMIICDEVNALVEVHSTPTTHVVFEDYCRSPAADSSRGGHCKLQ